MEKATSCSYTWKCCRYTHTQNTELFSLFNVDLRLYRDATVSVTFSGVENVRLRDDDIL